MHINEVDMTSVCDK